jgi:hypothetical protein
MLRNKVIDDNRALSNFGAGNGYGHATAVNVSFLSEIVAFESFDWGKPWPQD